MTDSLYVDWAAFWAEERKDRQWLLEPILAYGRGHSLYASQKVGKSLLTQWMALTLTACGDTIIIYLDYEMGEDDLHDRLTDFGYGPEIDLSRLRYALLPSIPPLDTVQGGNALFKLVDVEQAAHPEKHIAVIIDTTSRAFQGPENDSDTTRAFYRCTGLGLKQREVTWARLDHAGKDQSKGQRGSSAKGDDVDVVWNLARSKDTYILSRRASRMAWVPEKVRLDRSDGPLNFDIVHTGPTAAAIEFACILTVLRVPIDCTNRQARTVLKAESISVPNDVLAEAIRYRKSTERVTEHSDSVPSESSPEHDGMFIGE